LRSIPWATIVLVFCSACAPPGPSADQVARRAFVLAAMVLRSGLEGSAGDSGAEARRVEMLRWLDTAGVTAALEPEELEILRAPLGTLTEQQQKNAGWRSEGLGVLAWALNRWELDSFEVPTNAPAIAEALGFMKPEGLEMLKSPELRSKPEREELARRLYLIHRRLRQAYDKKASSRNIAQLARELKVDSVKLGLVEDDLTIGGIRLAKVPREVLRYAISTVAERHRAANWLLGDNPAYSKVSYALRGAR
jgi:hypothetical protein